jgi:hypothetical protein
MLTTADLSRRGLAPTTSQRPTVPIETLPLLLLYRHLLDQAMRDAIGGYRNGQPTALSQDAHAWICHRGLTNGGGITFDLCCHHLNLSSEHYRQQLLREIWRQRLQYADNPAALRSRMRSYGRQVHQVHKQLTAIDDFPILG